MKHLFATREQSLMLEKIFLEWKTVFNWYWNVLIEDCTDEDIICDYSDGGRFPERIPKAGDLCEVHIDYADSYKKELCDGFTIAPSLQELLDMLPEYIDEQLNIEDAYGGLSWFADCRGMGYEYRTFYSDNPVQIIDFPITAQGAANLLIWVYNNHPRILTHIKI
jgi:hypothetical protein